jgi:hypothetical protein
LQEVEIHGQTCATAERVLNHTTFHPPKVAGSAILMPDSSRDIFLMHNP